MIVKNPRNDLYLCSVVSLPGRVHEGGHRSQARPQGSQHLLTICIGQIKKK